MGGGVVYLPETAEVIAVPGFGNEGGYGEIRKVRISRVVNISTVIDFAGKKSKAKSEGAKRKERAVEALACRIEHVGLIKFWAVNSKTMEAYTLWWNDGSFRSFMRINSKVSLAEDYENILNHPAHTMHELEMIKAYRTKAAKLAMSLIITMARVHKNKILHNDISPSNILLYFSPDHVDRIYIGVCDWGMATRFIEDEHSVYGYPTKAKMEKNKEHYWVAPQLFYIYGPPNSETAIERVRWKHLYTPESDAYLVGKLALRIWNDEWDRDLFKTVEYGSIFLLKLTALTNEDQLKGLH
jgi:serine/threonine protein kinase